MALVPLDEVHPDIVQTMLGQLGLGSLVGLGFERLSQTLLSQLGLGLRPPAFPLSVAAQRIGPRAIARARPQDPTPSPA